MTDALTSEKDTSRLGLDAESIEGIVSIAYLGVRKPVSCFAISVYGLSEDYVDTVLTDEGFDIDEIRKQNKRRCIGSPEISTGTLDEGFEYVEKLDSEDDLTNNPNDIGIGIGTLVEIKKYHDMEKPVALLTSIGCD